LNLFAALNISLTLDLKEENKSESPSGREERTQEGEEGDIPHNQHSMRIPTPRPERNDLSQRELIKVMNHDHLFRIK